MAQGLEVAAADNVKRGVRGAVDGQSLSEISAFMELKTVQNLDGEELRKAVAKPCIQAEDEGYNCEWSTELTVPEAYDEYVKAYFAIAVLGRELGLGTVDEVAGKRPSSSVFEMTPCAAHSDGVASRVHGKGIFRRRQRAGPPPRGQ